MSEMHVDLNPAVESVAPLFREIIGGRGPLDEHEWDQLAELIMVASLPINAQFARWLASVGPAASAQKFTNLAEQMERGTLRFRDEPPR